MDMMAARQQALKQLMLDREVADGRHGHLELRGCGVSSSLQMDELEYEDAVSPREPLRERPQKRDCVALNFVR